ncbi:barstar family protein [Nocardia thailandica]|uniref:Barstar family protein n=1 Tax=Nocardia thailandica TaxID=257275 RepID=A0ABW6PK15_9NOCA|nr:barstar family protein [Nocardia thailandica]
MPEPMPLSQFLAGPAAELPSAGGPAVLGALPADAAQFGGIRYTAPAAYVVRELRGDRMRTVAGLFDEFAAAFQFPYYFGANKDAFDECLRDLDDFVGEAPGYVAAVRDADGLLAEVPTEREWFTAAVTDAAAYWHRREVAFRVVLQGPGTGFPAIPLIDRS